MANVLISGYYGYGNFGDEAILSVLVDYLRRKNHNITVLSGNPSRTAKSLGVKAVKNFNLLGIMIAMANCDILISGGGSLLQDVTSLKSLKYYSFIIRLAQKMHKKVVIFAQGIGPLNSEYAKKNVPLLLSKCDIVTVRDEKSLEFLKENGIDAQLVSDPLFSIELPINESKGAVGVQLRAFKNIDDIFLHNLAEYIAEHFGDRKIELFVLQESLDYPICKKFEKILKKTAPYIETEIIHNMSQNDIIIRISQLEYMIAMRFHAVLVAIKTGIKTLAINYDAKVAKLAYEAMLPLLTISVDTEWQTAFETLKQLDSQRILDFANTQHFDWSIFDDIID